MEEWEKTSICRTKKNQRDKCFFCQARGVCKASTVTMWPKYSNVKQEYEKLLGHGDQYVCKKWSVKTKKTKKRKNKKKRNKKVKKAKKAK